MYSQTKTVRHGMRAAIVVVAGRGGARRVDGVRRGETNACAAARAATRMRSAIRAVSTCRVDAMCLIYACGPYARRFTAAASESASALRWDCFTRARSALEGLARCKDSPRRCVLEACAPWLGLAALTAAVLSRAKAAAGRGRAKLSAIRRTTAQTREPTVPYSASRRLERAKRFDTFGRAALLYARRRLPPHCTWKAHSQPQTDAAIEGTALVAGATPRATGRLAFSKTGLSFWGGVDPVTGTVIDERHPLCGRLITDTILAIPSGRGAAPPRRSCSSSS